jgi:hypothetical protein
MFITKAIRPIRDGRMSGPPGGWMADAFPLSGGIDPKAFPFLLAHLHRQAATGSLKVDGPFYQKAVYFRGGRILFGSSNDPKDQLGAILIETGRISPEQLEEVSAKVGPGSPLAKVLAESGFVNQRELSEAARTKVERILADMLSYDTGSFEFEDGVLPKGAVDLKLVTERLIVAAVRRITDRAFVLRHIEGLDVVLVATTEAKSKSAGLDAETAMLPQRFDGRRNIKDVAADARLDEFDAAKTCCALLFLGLLERSRPGEEDTRPDSPALFTPGDLGAELDLGEQARLALEGPGALASSEPDTTLVLTEPPDLGKTKDHDTEPPGVLELPLPPALPTIKRLTLPRRPTPVVVAPAPAPPPATAIPRPEPETMILPGPGEGPATTGFFNAQHFVGTDAESEAAAPPKTAPPSKEDLAALDALLNARHVEGPLAPLEKVVTHGTDRRWEPRFDGGARKTAVARRGLGRLLGAVAVLGVAVAAAAWFFLPRPRATATAPVPVPPTLPAVTTTTLPEPTTLATEPVSTPAPTAPPATTLSAPRPTLPPVATPPRGQSTGSLGEARAALRRGELAEAARGFSANIRAAHGSYTVQLLVACADDTVSKAVQAVPAPDLFIIPASYKGRSCYRMCWGLYDDEARAHAGVASVPEYFRKGGALPKAVSAASILP